MKRERERERESCKKEGENKSQSNTCFRCSFFPFALLHSPLACLLPACLSHPLSLSLTLLRFSSLVSSLTPFALSLASEPSSESLHVRLPETAITSKTMRLTCTSTDRVTLLNVKYYINIILVTLLIIQCTLVAASPSPSSSSSPTTSSPSSTASSLSPDSKKINLNSNKSKIPVVSQVTSSKSPSSSVIPGPPHHTFSASQVSPSHSPSNQIQDSVIKVAGQLLASEPSSTPPPTAYYDKSFPSCTLGWESNPSLVHYDLISGHYLIDTPYRVTDDLEPSNCLRDCTRDPDCKSLNIDYKRGTCEFIQARVRESPLIDQTRLPTQYNLVQRNNLRASLGQNYFEKICLQNASLCSTKDWSFERIKSAKFSSFIFNNTSTGKYLNYNLTIIESINSREICLSLCINENRFICRAAIYDTNGKICWLSSINRFSSPDIKLERALNYEYYESNCVSEARGFCNTKGAKDQKQLLSERILFTSTLDECQSECIASSTSGVNVPSLPLHTTGQVSSVNVTHDTLDSSSGQAQATSGVQKPSESMYHLNSNNILHHPSKPTISLPSPSTTGFICRSFSYEASSHTCSLSHHSSRTSVQSLIRSPGYVYFELASCFDGKYCYHRIFITGQETGHSRREKKSETGKEKEKESESD